MHWFGSCVVGLVWVVWLVAKRYGDVIERSFTALIAQYRLVVVMNCKLVPFLCVRSADDSFLICFIWGDTKRANFATKSMAMNGHTELTWFTAKWTHSCMHWSTVSMRYAKRRLNSTQRKTCRTMAFPFIVQFKTEEEICLNGSECAESYVSVRVTHKPSDGSMHEWMALPNWS